MKILYDHQVFSWQIYGGISRYFVELFKQWGHQENISFDLSLKFSNNVYLHKEFEGQYAYFMQERRFRGKATLMNVLNRLITKKVIARNDFDILHATYYNDYFLNDLKKPFVLTIHDMTNERLKHLYPVLDDTWLIENKRKLAIKADKIITISNHAKNDILEFYPEIPQDKIEVIYHGFPKMSRFEKSTSSNDRLPKKYLLYVGSRAYYKNFKFFIKAITSFLKKNLELYIVLAGGGHLSNEENKFLQNTGVAERIKYIPFTTNEELSSLYSQSLAFVFPSLYEGFGLPVLEAFACQTPVVVSNNSALPEIGGDAVLSFDPLDENDLLEKLEQVIQENTRVSMIAKGNERLKYFGWKKTSRETFKVYKSILE